MKVIQYCIIKLSISKQKQKKKKKKDRVVSKSLPSVGVFEEPHVDRPHMTSF